MRIGTTHVIILSNVIFKYAIIKIISEMPHFYKAKDWGSVWSLFTANWVLVVYHGENNFVIDGMV